MFHSRRLCVLGLSLVAGMMFGFGQDSWGYIVANFQCGDDHTSCSPGSCVRGYNGFSCAEFKAIDHLICTPVVPDFTLGCNKVTMDCASFTCYSGQACNPANNPPDCQPYGRPQATGFLTEDGCNATIIFFQGL